MPPKRLPGPKGINNKHEKIDSGTLARTSTAPPKIRTSFGKAKEGVSWSVAIKAKHAYTDTAGLTVAEIYFATDDDKVHSDDILAMNKLIKSITSLLKEGFKCRLLCTGKADYRASFHYNMNLGMRRAKSVKRLIDSRISNKELRVDVTSIGESKALQPRHVKHPLLVKIMKDRKVVITIDAKGLTPPVVLSVTGNWHMGNRSIEKIELNNGGIIVQVFPREVRDTRKEERLEHDPILPLVLIETHYSIKKINNKEEAHIECKVIHRLTNRLLFTASAQTDASKTLKEQIVTYGQNSGIKRKVDPGLTIPKGHVVEESIIFGVNNRALLLLEPIYAHLKGKYKNITKRVEAVLAQHKGSHLNYYQSGGDAH